MRIFVYRVLVFLIAASFASGAQANELRNHPSPYLAMHGGDPVQWLDWKPAAVERARREKKLLYLSIGYFSCHWCHVMQRESYQNAEIARFLNRHFVPVKIDRELEPALDARMITFAEATRGMGGWPLNVFITPDGHPLYAALYLPPKDFLTVLQRLEALWRTDAKQLAALARAEAPRAQGPGEPRVPAEGKTYARLVAAGALSLADMVHGGFGEQSKFPSVPQLRFLLAEQLVSGHAQLKEFLLLTLDQMAARGLYDHVGGGFYRYTVDPGWKTPHFEKMLYDNALLAELYLDAARAFGRPDYERVARETLDFMLRELKDPSGAFIASLSAVDDRNIEGGFYLWDVDTLKKALSAAELEVVSLAWGMGDAPPFEDGYVPMMQLTPDELAKKLGRKPGEIAVRLESARAKLLRARGKRVLPRDTKLLAAWNGLALSALTRAAAQTGDERYRRSAQALRDYLVSALWNGTELMRAKDGKKAIGAAALEDYAYVVAGLVDWAERDGGEADFKIAAAMARAAWERFYGQQGWRLGARALIAEESGQDLIADGPMPSPSAVLIDSSLRLAARLKDEDLRGRALAALNSGHELLKKDPYWYASQVGVMRALERSGG